MPPKRTNLTKQPPKVVTLSGQGPGRPMANSTPARSPASTSACASPPWTGPRVGLARKRPKDPDSREPLDGEEGAPEGASSGGRGYHFLREEESDVDAGLDASLSAADSWSHNSSGHSRRPTSGTGSFLSGGATNTAAIGGLRSDWLVIVMSMERAPLKEDEMPFFVVRGDNVPWLNTDLPHATLEEKRQEEFMVVIGEDLHKAYGAVICGKDISEERAVAISDLCNVTYRDVCSNAGTKGIANLVGKMMETLPFQAEPKYGYLPATFPGPQEFLWESVTNGWMRMSVMESDAKAVMDTERRTRLKVREIKVSR